MRAQPDLEWIVAQFDQDIFDAGLAKGLFEHGALVIAQLAVEAHHMGDGIAQRKAAFENLAQTAHQSIFEVSLVRDQQFVGREREFGTLIDELIVAALFDLDAVAIDRNVDVEPAYPA